jgi:predicted transcriptional regulator
MTTLPVRTRSVITSDGPVAVRHMLHVVCPGRRGSVDLEVCRTCPRLHAASERFVECTPVVAPRDGDDAVASIVPSRVTLARAEVTVATLESLVPPELLVPVIDEEGRFRGFFATSHAAGPSLPPRLARTMPVGSRVFGTSLVVHEGTPWPQALRLMARRRGRVLAVTDDAGVVRGVLSDLDALRAMARPFQP